ncbi:MAG TPA: MerC domain-containing protein [Thermoanaerobaculia bacterium]|nr:MerC domain-containing protein [Thermoanaerobaculia bacterium]
MRRNPMPWLGSSGGLLATVIPHCPFCAAASGTLLSSLGLGFLATSGVGRWLVPVFLLVGVLGLAVGARRHRAWWVLAVGVIGSLGVYAGWSTERQAIVWTGAVVVLVASIINFQLQRRPMAPLVQIGKGDAR